MKPFAWECPFCNRVATITDEKFKSVSWKFAMDNRYGPQYVILRATVCPHPDCREYTLRASVHDQKLVYNEYRPAEAKQDWALVPPARMKVFPSYVPEVILADYREACLIRDLSPKASATLARRCLQGLIRDFWGVSKSRLVDEIAALKDKVDAVTWQAIDAVRSIGNVGAHMERDINLIVDVDPQEAQLLIELIETLITEWYVGRHERQERMSSVIATSKAKQEQKASGRASGEDAPVEGTADSQEGAPD